MTINIIDTPGHADFGGEVERGLSMVDGIVLLVDASEGPLPQTRFVLRKALNADMPVVLVVNKVDRADARIAEVVDETYELFMDLLDEQPQPGRARLPGRLRLGQGRPRVARACPRTAACPTAPTSSRCSRRSSRRSRRPTYAEGAPLQAHVTNLDASPFLGRLALVRVHEGTLKKGQTRRLDEARRHGQERQDHRAAGHRGPRAQARRVRPAPATSSPIAGIPDITIGETLADPRTRSRCR